MKIPPASQTPINPMDPGVSEEQKAKLKQVSQQFESLFVNHMVTEMRKTVGRGGLVPQSQGEKVWQSMLDTEYSQQIAKSEEIGLSKMIYEHLLRNR